MAPTRSPPKVFKAWFHDKVLSNRKRIYLARLLDASISSEWSNYPLINQYADQLELRMASYISLYIQYMCYTENLRIYSVQRSHLLWTVCTVQYILMISISARGRLRTRLNRMYTSQSDLWVLCGLRLRSTMDKSWSCEFRCFLKCDVWCI